MHRVVQVLGRADAMCLGMGSDLVTYADPQPTLQVFRTLITNVRDAQVVVRQRTVGAAATRDVELALLIEAMESERLYIQKLASANAARAIEIIENAGLVVAKPSGHGKGMLELRNGDLPGSVECDANVKLLIGAGAPHPYATRFFNWEHTVDNGASFLSAPSTNHGKTLITGLTPLTRVGVRVSITILGVTSPWTDVATILVI
jgi:hypothetical protein